MGAVLGSLAATDHHLVIWRFIPQQGSIAVTLGQRHGFIGST